MFILHVPVSLLDTDHHKTFVPFYPTARRYYFTTIRGRTKAIKCFLNVCSGAGYFNGKGPFVLDTPKCLLACCSCLLLMTESFVWSWGLPRKRRCQTRDMIEIERSIDGALHASVGALLWTIPPGLFLQIRFCVNYQHNYRSRRRRYKP